MVEITEKAAKRILELMKDSEVSDGGGLRFKVVPGGCSGMQYALSMEAGPVEGDNEYEKEIDDGAGKKIARVFVDSQTAMYVEGTTIDYGRDPVGHNLSDNFIIRNPNQKHSCGCGISFST